MIETAMAPTRTRKVIALHVEEAMREEFAEKQYVMFYPQQFSALGSEEEIVGALGDLQRSDKVTLEGVVRCANGHSVFQGTLDDAAQYAKRRCNQCVLDESPCGVYLRARLSSDWKGILEAHVVPRPHEEKKTATCRTSMPRRYRPR